ncbi:MAG: hypothetical protein KAJ72_01735 [Candidatus Heimdallarchaeota archaeon]|nr:hypothetical protein [Candidatus Heimdallarchaeota archaeon]
MTLKEEFQKFTKNPWGIGVIISWILLIIFSFYYMIWSFIIAALPFSGINVLMGLIQLLVLGSAVLYLLTYLIEPKVNYDSAFLYKVFSFVPLGIIYILAVLAGYLNFATLLWPYSTMFLASIGVILCTYYFLKKKDETPIATGQEEI